MSNSVPYIGSRMSLISKAEIRYEGFLHEIDTSNTTVTLKNVRSFGTENRRSDKVIPPKDDVFQYIIFRGSDIKDISVCETSAFTDPAIVQSGPPADGNRPNVQSNPGATLTPETVSPTPASFPPFAMPAPPQTKPHPPTVPSPQLFRPPIPATEAQQISPEPLVDQSRSLNSGNDQADNRSNVPPRQAPRQGMGQRNDRGDNRSYSATARQYNRNYDYAPRSYAYNPSGNPYNNSYNSGGGFRNNNSSAPTAPLMGSNTQGNRQMSGNRNYNYQNNYRWNQNGPNRRMGPRNRLDEQTGGNSDLRIDEDFDIDDANRKFDKSQLVKEFASLDIQEEVEAEAQVHNLADLEDGEVADESRTTEAAKFYDKSKSFFDSISCDALEKKSNRLTTAEEKRLNVQTFGAPSVNRNRPSGPHNYNNSGGGSGGFRPRGNYHGEGNNYRRGNYYGGFNNSNYRRGPGGNQNSYYTSNYSGGNRDRQNNYQHRNNHQSSTNNSSNSRLSQPAQA